MQELSYAKGFKCPVFILLHLYFEQCFINILQIIEVLLCFLCKFYWCFIDLFIVIVICNCQLLRAASIVMGIVSLNIQCVHFLYELKIIGKFLHSSRTFIEKLLPPFPVVAVPAVPTATWIRPCLTESLEVLDSQFTVLRHKICIII
jgi:hypothetical protein